LFAPEKSTTFKNVGCAAPECKQVKILLTNTIS
jgi:hypothetical protein